MQDVTLDSSQPVNGTAANNESSDRTTQLQQLYFNCYADLEAAAYKAHSALLVFDLPKVLNSVDLRNYRGPLERGPFLKWAKARVSSEAQRYAITEKIIREHRAVIFGAIRDCLWRSAIDESVTADDIFSEITALIFAKAHSLNRRGTARMSTRVYALTKRHIKLYHNRRNRRRRNLVVQRLASGQKIRCEVLSPEEIASMNPAPDPYDPGYTECGILAA